MDFKQTAKLLIEHPAELAHALGYPDMTDELHGNWIRRIMWYDADQTLQAHRGSYKTTALSIAIALIMCLFTDKNIIFLRKTDNDIAEVIANIQRIIKHPVFQQMYFALTGQTIDFVTATKSELTTTAYTAPRGSAQLLGIGVGGSLTGKHADFIFTDDIVNRSDRYSRAERERTKAVYQELQNIRNKGGRIINTGTPWHKDDAFTLMPEPIRFDCYQTGLISDERLETLRHSMSPSLFAANYELRHIATENALFDTAPSFIEDAVFLRDGVAHVDASYGGEDYTAFTCGKRINDKLYIYGRLFKAHVDTVLDTIVNDCRRLMCSPVYCESNADKGYLGRELRNRGMQVRIYNETENKYAKISTFGRKWWQNVVFLKGTDPDYIAQIMDYTEQAEHDDAPDSYSCVCRIFDRGRIDL